MPYERDISSRWVVFWEWVVITSSIWVTAFIIAFAISGFVRWSCFSAILIWIVLAILRRLSKRRN